MPAIVVGVLYGRKVDDVCKPGIVRDQGLQTHEVESFVDTINVTKCVQNVYSVQGIGHTSQ